MSVAKASGSKWLVLGILLGGLLVGAPCCRQFILSRHHYEEVDTFFRGSVKGKQVLGITYREYDGIGFMEGERWKVLLDNDGGDPMTIYQRRSCFQESVPHQPQVEIAGDFIQIDDGESKLRIQVQQ